MLNVEQIAQVCHEANRTYCRVVLLDYSQPDWLDAPLWQKDSALGGVQFHLNELRAGGIANPAASHENWLKQKLSEGWVYGEIKNPERKEHPCMLPYDQLPFEQRLKDYIFCAIVTAFWQADQQHSKEKEAAA